MDEVIKSRVEYQPHEDRLYVEKSQPTRNAILERNAELRKNPGVIQDLGAQSGSTWGRQVASIPMIDYYNALRDGFDLNNSDKTVRNRELNRFLQTDIGRACLVQGKN
jgi:hypothetical protein